MSISLTNETKNSITLTPESKQSTDPTFAQTDPETFGDEAGNTFGFHGVVLTKESKNAISLTGETKN